MDEEKGFDEVILFLMMIFNTSVDTMNISIIKILVLYNILI